MSGPVLADSSIWIASFRQPFPLFVEVARSERFRIHPFVIAELALGGVPDRAATLANLAAIRPVRVASHAAVMAFIEREALAGSGVGYVDAHLAASCLLMPGTKLWTADKPLLALAERLGIAAKLTN